MTARNLQDATLSATQLLLLSAASERQDHLIVKSDAVTARAFARALIALTKLGFVAAVEHPADVSDREASEPSFVVTAAGLSAIGVPQPVQARSKQDHIIALLSREAGATLDELIRATGWLPHTTRAALTGLRHKGYGIERTQRADKVSNYRIVSIATKRQAA